MQTYSQCRRNKQKKKQDRRWVHISLSAICSLNATWPRDIADSLVIVTFLCIVWLQLFAGIL